MKYLIILLLIISYQSNACVSLQEKFDSDAFIKARKADEDPIVEAIEVYVPARIGEYEANYSYIYLKEGDNLVLASSTSVTVAPIPKTLPIKKSYKALYLSVQKKHKSNIELEVHYVKHTTSNEISSCNKVRRYKLDKLRAL